MTYLGVPGLRSRLLPILRGVFRPREANRYPAGRILVVGHRGSPRLEAENTLASFGRALEEGADAIEADVCRTKDGEFVIWHDADPNGEVALLRQAGREGLLFRPDVPEAGSADRRPVRELSSETFLRTHGYVRNRETAPDGRPAAARASIVTLAQLLDWAPGQPALTDVLLDIKLAEDQAADAAALVEVLEARAAAGALGGISMRLLSPQAEIVAALRDAVGGRPGAIRVSADFELPGAPERGPETGVRDVSLGLGRRLWPGFREDAARCVEARVRGVFDAVVAWTINGARRLRELAALGVDGILTDEAPVLRAIVGPASAEPSSAPPGRQIEPGRK